MLEQVPSIESITKFASRSVGPTDSERVRFVCLSDRVSPGAFCLDLVSNREDDVGIEVETVLVVLAPALAAVAVGAFEEPQHVGIREVVLNAFQRRERVHTVGVSHALVPGLDRLRASRRLAALVEVRERFEQ